MLLDWTWKEQGGVSTQLDLMCYTFEVAIPLDPWQLHQCITKYIIEQFINISTHLYTSHWSFQSYHCILLLFLSSRYGALSSSTCYHSYTKYRTCRTRWYDQPYWCQLTYEVSTMMMMMMMITTTTTTTIIIQRFWFPPKSECCFIFLFASLLLEITWNI